MTTFKLTIAISMCILQEACFQKPKHIDEYTVWFEKNKTELVLMKDSLLSRPKIERVELGSRQKKVANYEEFSEQDHLIYNQIVEKCRELGIKNITVAYESENGNLISVRFTLYSSGFLNSGYLVIGASFIPDEGFIDRVSRKKGRKFFSQSISDWYIFEYK